MSYKETKSQDSLSTWKSVSVTALSFEAVVPAGRG